MSDEEIYELHIDGDKYALTMLEDNYRYKLMLYVCCYVDDMCKAKEIVDKVFYRISIFYYDELKKNFCAYIYRMARDFSLKYIKEYGLKQRFYIELPANDYDDDLSWIENQNKIETNKLLYTALNKIGQEEREEIFLDTFQNIGENDIAIILKKSKRKVNKTLKKSKKKLKDILSKSQMKNFIY